MTEKEGLINKLKKANRELDEFTSIASHDLRAPLNAIKRLLEWISDDCEALLPDEHLENFQLVISRANRMQTLLEDLLKYAKIDQCDVTLSTTTLEAVYQDVAQLLDIPSSMTINIESGNSQINIPAVPFKTVILNLLSNAIKHNDKTHGIINISLRPALHYYVIEVADNGPGIDPKYFSLIFQLFQTLRSRDEVEGTGIGLSVVKKHVTNFGGKVDVSSNGKTGTTFTIFWPKQHLNS
ncbi:sensor histidine kinase [Pseudoalteromonas espejiana]